MDQDVEPTDHEGRVIDFGRRAHDYDRYRPGFPDGFFDLLVERGWIAAGMVGLDLGTGTGTVALGLAARGLEVTGIDISRELLEVARKTADERNLTARFIEGTAENTGEPDSGYDIVRRASAGGGSTRMKPRPRHAGS